MRLIGEASEPILTIEELATELQASVRSVRRHVAAGVIPALRLGPRTTRFLLSDVVGALRVAGLAREGRKAKASLGQPFSMLEHLKSKASNWGMVPDELERKRQQKEGRHGT